MPDRFANGNCITIIQKIPKNKQTEQSSGGRHGGDIQGIINHLDYIAKLEQPLYGARRFAKITTKNSLIIPTDNDVYKIDSRYGTNEDYKKLASNYIKKT
jgi:glycosidase